MILRMDLEVLGQHVDLFSQYGEPKLQAAMAECLTDSHDHNIPPALAAKVAAYAV